MPRAESMRETLAREAAEAEAAAAREDAEEQGARRSGQRARTSTPPASQVYSLRLPVEAIDKLRAVGDRLGEAPTALLRRFVLERLDQETRPARAEAKDPLETALAEMLPALRRRLDELAMAIEE